MSKLILHVLNTGEFSGAENVAIQIIKMYQKERNYKMIYCSLDGPIRDVLLNKNIDFEPIQKMNIKEIRRVINKYKPDIIHAHDMKASFFVSIACKNTPFVCHIHNNNFNSRNLSLKVILFRTAAKKSRHIFWVSKSAMNGFYFKEQVKEKSSILYNVINAEEVRKNAELACNVPSCDIIYLGRLSPEKNPLRLLDLIFEIKKTIPYITLGIIGTGELEAEIIKKIDKLQLNDNVTLFGFQSNPYPFLKKSKLMLMTSLWEGLPMCALEAISLGIPIVSTPTDGLCELVIDGKTGFLSNDNIDLANKIVLICNNSDLRKNMSLATLAQAEKLLDLKKYKNELTTYYE